MKNYIILFAALMISTLANASDNTYLLEEEYLKGRSVKLNSQEKAALEISKRWRSNNNSDKPIQGDNGNVTYLFGASQPVLICAPLEVCILQLEPGEAISAMKSGDTVRWEITPTVVGHKGLMRTEVIVKTTQVGLVSSLYIGTNKRSYNIKLKSTRTQFIPFMNFVYPENLENSLAKYRKKLKQDNQKNTINTYSNNEDGEIQKQHVTDLDFEYKIDGKALFKPLRVYNDGIRTVLQMPEEIRNTDLPSLLVIDESNDKNLVNYRVINNRFIVDKVFDKAVLIAGVGGKQKKIHVERKTKKIAISKRGLRK